MRSVTVLSLNWTFGVHSSNEQAIWVSLYTAEYEWMCILLFSKSSNLLHWVIGELGNPTNTVSVPMGLLWYPRKHRSENLERKRETTVLSVEAFRGQYILVIHLYYNNLSKLSVFKEEIRRHIPAILLHQPQSEQIQCFQRAISLHIPAILLHQPQPEQVQCFLRAIRPHIPAILFYQTWANSVFSVGNPGNIFVQSLATADNWCVFFIIHY